ncbi:hypothetical protein QC763_0046850 [Podospora pseudopauciseta]|uniref:Uncharacterized protein n=1 Tax=Podospora pseudopauciseta TaxID=2093780 RepID=A0ABR0HEZ5_9PEZI|nr:hypothetical protein QC763_0046850 [Podospora pseudopauciseta]
MTCTAAARFMNVNESLLRTDMPPEDHDGTDMVEVPWIGLSPQQPTPRHPCTLSITFKTTMRKKYRLVMYLTPR